ncbi:conserved hypothetical protein [Leishmania mexicana MHOM/GT/2001/U1103]|uniref:Uncharacterized protein n=1 Tax=Leishmania mexicana (strain MHOM/GT/2001/U1103) TaxID=929439 RepID=E9B0Y3_LEIMU|nr:conserved hypothetical protein [Leishmania mexicana MHOM/GT/2001/U1103]CBZ28888.1 conserved hypothetical protein [Leishmania mexicana MHOM/GT/2001/U1103]
MSALWARFTDKLKGSGYTLSDLVYCSEDTFLTLVTNMNAFTPLQIASLAKEWQRSLSAAATPTVTVSGSAFAMSRPHAESTRLSSSPAPSSALNRATLPATGAAETSPNHSTLSTALRENAFVPPPRSPAKVKEEAEYLLTKLGAQSGVEYQVSLTEGIVAVEASPEAWGPLLDRVSRMHLTSHRDSAASPATVLQLLWKLCSPATLRKMEKACVSGAPFGLSNQDDADGLCSSAVVLYDKDATRLAAPAQELEQLFREGWGLVAFDVAVGKARTVTKEEAQDLNANLYRFSMEQCLEMLEEAGFDAFHIPSRNAVAVCHMHQLMPRFVVFVSTLEPVVVTRRLGDAVPAVGNGRPSRAPPAPVALPSPFASAPAALPAVRGTINGGNDALALANRSPRNSEELQCAVHSKKMVEFWSPTEKRLLCSHCLYYDGYSQENCVPIEQAARDEAPRLERWVQNAITFSQEIKSVFGLFEAAQTDVSQTHKQVRSDIAHSFTRLRARLDALEANLQQQCQQKAQQNLQALQDTLSRIAATVQFVGEVVQDADEPVAAYRGGVADTSTCVALLRSAQRAFGAWEPVTISAYEDVRIVDGSALLQPVEEALKAVQPISSEAGKVQLPEAIDVNYLKSDCDV